MAYFIKTEKGFLIDIEKSTIIIINNENQVCCLYNPGSETIKECSSKEEAEGYINLLFDRLIKHRARIYRHEEN